MNIQTERLENHTARLVVQVENDRLDAAKRKAAQKLAGRVNIPGFRKGKAPYNVILRYFGEAALIEDAVEIVADEIYPQVLKEADVQAYGQGSLEKIDLEPGLTMTFTVALQPTANLGDYRNVRVDYDLPAVTDETVDRAMRSLQEQNAVVEESHQPVALTNRVTVDIHATFVDAPTQAATDTAIDEDNPAGDTTITDPAVNALSQALGAGATEGDNADVDPLAEDESDPLHEVDPETVFAHEHNEPIILDADHELVPGFNDALVGANVGETREFDLTIPQDAEKYEEDAGRTVHFQVTVHKIETMTLPALNDDFAARLTAEEERPLTLLELRMEMRKDLEQAAQQRYDSDYQVRVLDAIREQATLSYPHAIVHDEIHALLNQLDQNLKQQKLSLDVYKTIYRKSDDDLHEDYEPIATRNVERSLVMRELMVAERVRLTTQDLQDEIERVVAPFPEEQRAQLRGMFNNQQTLDNIANDVIRRKVLERIQAIARGENPPLETAETAPVAESLTLDATTDSDANNVDEAETGAPTNPVPQAEDAESSADATPEDAQPARAPAPENA